MPVDLHERLSEFSYGYGVTREVEIMLRTRGLVVTPFMPSLLQEAKLGFDVAFNKPGEPLMLQFKLGQAMRRFTPGPRPALDSGFWRYRIDTAEPDGQYEMLLKAQLDGADVFYVAPQFHDWESYLEVFEKGEVLDKSLIVTPRAIRDALVSSGQKDGVHRIVYDMGRAYVCSEPVKVQVSSASDIADKVNGHIRSQEATLAETVRRVFDGFDDRDEIRRYSETRNGRERLLFGISSDFGWQSELRRARVSRLRDMGRSETEAVALVAGAEAWSLGSQMIFVTLK